MCVRKTPCKIKATVSKLCLKLNNFGGMVRVCTSTTTLYCIARLGAEGESTMTTKPQSRTLVVVCLNKSVFIFLLFCQVSWIRRSDAHILTVDEEIFISDARISTVHENDSTAWNLQIKWVNSNNFVLRLPFWSMGNRIIGQSDRFRTIDSRA